MIEVKFHKGVSKPYNVSLNEFKKATKEEYPYLQDNGNGKEAFALCPLCENPVKLLGVYAKLNKQSPHARHYKNDVNGVARHDEYRYLHCPNHRKKGNYVTEVRAPKDMTAFNEEVLALAHGYFDKCIYILRKTTGLVISNKLAEEIARDYMAHPGYMTYDITKDNVPYIMGLCMRGKHLVGRTVEKDSALFQMLSNKEDVTLTLLPNNSDNSKHSNENNNPDNNDEVKDKSKVELYRIESAKGYLGLSFNLVDYRFVSGATEKLREFITLHIGIPDGEGTYKTYVEKEIEVDPFFFSKLICSKNALPPRKELADIAESILILKS